ncbi:MULTISPECIES: AraC family transcriptional regulator [Sphingobium]|uniref:AraC family transcriptional regulator n=1 Tax=Sphingobium TaxID=165695 RepID=UPI000C5924CA|nr:MULTISPECIES: AraC family transcriptional regulator [Sphingobium]MBS87422.1 AraC family transcriptional regulator [Sphingobium sp.]QWT16228.1 AraC family transcriptional regulator [Sphingobium xenophagum]
MTDHDNIMMIDAMASTAHPGALFHLESFLRSEGLPVSKTLARHARAASLTDNAIDAVSPSLIIQALEDSATTTGRPDLAVAFSQWVNIRGFGPLSLLGEQCPTLRYAIEARRRYMHVVNGAYSMDLELIEDEAHILHTVLPSFRERAGQFLAGVMVFTVRLARRALGPGWSPLRVEFGYERHADLRSYDRFFHCPVSFGAERFAVVCPRADIDRPLPGHDPDMLAFVEGHLQKLAHEWPSSLEAQVERLIAANLEAGLATLDHIAEILAMSPRTLQRGLDASETSFADILALVRRKVAVSFFQEAPRRPIIVLAHLLGYSDASTVSRFLASTFGMSGRELRRRVMAGLPLS